MKVTKRQLKRIIREVGARGEGDTVATPWQEALRIVQYEHQDILDTESGDSDMAFEKLRTASMSNLAEQLADWMSDYSGVFKDYPGDEDALWDSMLDTCEMIIQEALTEYELSL